MEYCKHCSKPIISDEENQIYCNYVCFQDYLKKKDGENSVIRLKIEKATEPAHIVWFSIIAMIVGLFGILFLISAIIESVELSLYFN